MDFTIAIPIVWTALLLLFISLPSCYGASTLQIITHPQDQLAESGIDVTFTCEATGDPPITYQWFFNDIEIFSATNTSYTLISDFFSYGSYHCNATSSMGQEVASNSATLTVSPKGNVIIFSGANPTGNVFAFSDVSPEGNVLIFGDVITSFGSAVNFTCLSDSGPNNTYEWTNGQGESVSNSSQLQLSSITGSDAGDYTCTVTNAAGSGNETATVTVAPYNVMIMGVNLYNQGEQLQLNCLSEGGLVLEYTWLFSDSIIPNANNNTLIINNVNTTHGGDYTCNVTNDAGFDSDMITVYIAPYNVNIIGIRRYPFGSNIELNCTSEGGPQLEYNWIFLDTTIDTDAMLMRNGIVSNGGDYTCNVTNNAGFDSNTTTVYIGPRFVTDPVDSQEVVINGTFTLTCIAEGFPIPSITWFMNGTMISNGVSDVMAMNVQNSTLTISIASFSDSCMYYCEAVSSEFSDLNVTSGIANITVVEQPVVRPTEHNVTLGSSVTFDCDEFGSPNFTYQWYMRDAVTVNDILLVNETGEFYTILSTMYNDTGGYFCEASNSLGVFSNSTPAQLLVRPSIVEHPMMQMVYPGVTTSFSCRAEGFSKLSYSWFVVAANADIGMEIENETNTTYTNANPMYRNNASGYYCITSNNEGIAVSNTVLLTVLRPAITEITIIPAPSVGGTLLHQFTDSVSLTCTAEGGPRIMTRWQFDDGSTVANGSSSVTYNVSSLSTDHTGVYYCVAIIDGMTVTSAMNYTLFVAPYKVNAMGSNLYSQGQQLMLNCVSEGGPQLEYIWIFLGSEIANTAILMINNVNTTHGGDYTCNVTNDAGFDSDLITVYIGVLITAHPQDELVNVSDSVNFTCEASGSLPINYRWLYNGSYIMNDPGHIEGVNTSTLMIVNVNVTDWGMYSCEASNIVDNATSNEATLYVSPLGTVDVTPNDMAVDHMTSSVTFTCQSMAGPNLNYTWLINDSSEALSNDDIVVNDFQLTVNNVTYLLGGRYTCVVTNLAGQGEESRDLFVNPFIVTDPQSQLAVNDSTVSFICTAIAFPAPVYNWSTPIPNTDFNTSTITILVDYSYFGNYTCFAESNGTIATSRSALLTVSPQGSVKISPVNITTTFNSTVTITCSAEGGPNNMFEWSEQETGVISRNSVLEFQMIVGSDGAVYECTVSNAAGNETRNVTLTVAPYDATVTETVDNNNVTYACNAEGGPVNTYEWLRLRDNETISMTQELTLDNTDPLDGGEYQCTITNAAGNTSAMTTHNVGVVITTHPQDELVNVSDSVNFTCEASGSLPINYRWLYNGSYIMNDPGHIEGVNTSTLMIVNVNVTDWGMYSCEAINIVDNTTSNEATLYVSPLGTVDVTPNDMAVDHMTNSVTFTCKSMAGPNLNYTWLINGNSEALSNDNIVVNYFQLTVNNVTYLLGGRYTCVVANLAGQGEDSSDLFINPFIVTDPQSQLAVNDSTVSFTCTAIAFPAPVYNWFTPIPNTDFNTSTITILVDYSYFGDYICFAESNGTTAESLPALLTVSPLGSIEISPSINITATFNSTVTITCSAEGGPNNMFQWIKQGIDSEVVTNNSDLEFPLITGSDGAVYECTVSNAAGRETRNVTLTVGVVITAHPQDELVNVSDSVNFTCEASGSLPINYRWLYNGSYIMNDPGHIEGVNTSTLMIVNVNVTDWGMYSCEASNIVDNATSNEATLYVSPLGTVKITPNDMAVDHMTNSVTFTCQSMAGPNLSYTWFINGSSEALSNDDIVANDFQLTVNNVTYLLGGRYTCVVTNLAGQGEDSSDLFVNPFIVTEPQSQLVVNDSTVSFTCTAIAFPAPVYNWSTPIPNTDFNTGTITILVDYSYFGNYTCFAESNGTIAESLPALLTVSPQGSVEISPINIATIFNSTVTISCFAKGGPNNMFQWSKQETGVISSNSVLEFQMIIGSDGAVYECTVSNAAGNETRNVALTVAPYNATITETVDSNNVTYTCNAEGGPGNTYEWLRLRDNKTVSVTQELTLDNTDPLDGGEYQCIITNTADNTSAMTTLNVATVIVISPQTQNITSGESFTLICNATGYPVPSVEWILNGTSYIIRESSITTITLTEGLRSNTSNLTVTSAMTNDTGIYECVATNEVNTDTQDANVTVQNCPDEPINVQIFNVNSRNLTINWTEPHNNNDPITQYNISYQNPACLVGAGIAVQNVTITSMEEQVMINDLHPGEYYTFTIIAINSICPSQPSLPASMRTQEEIPRAAPVVSTSPDQRSINVSWMMLECQDRRGNITMYEARYTSTDFGDNIDQTLNTSSGDELNLEVDGLEEFTNYTIEVRAYTTIGPGPYSIPMNIQTLPDIPSDSVTNLIGVGVTPTSVELSWGPVNERDQNGIIQSYNIYYQLNESSDLYMTIVNVTERTRIISGLIEDEVYVFAVTAVNQVGESMVNASVMIQTNESAPSTPPENVMISNVTDRDDIAIDITWNPPTDPNGIIWYYRVEFVQDSDPLDNGGREKRDVPLDNMVMNVFINITSGSSGAPTNARLSRLVAYRLYNYSVFAATSVGEGPSADGSFLTREDTPLAPQNLTVSIPGVAHNSTTLLVNWERPLCDRGVLSGYELCYVESSVGDCDGNGITANITDPDQLSYTINDLSINTNYTVMLRGRTGAGLGDPASANGITDEDVPAPVMNIVTQFLPNNTIRGYYNITWTPPAPTNGSFYQILEYSYFSAYNVGPTYNNSFSTELDQNQNQFIFDALYFTDYNFTITTINIKYNISNGPFLISNQSSPAVPTAVRNIQVSMSTFESIYITWDHPEYPNSQLLNYTFYYNENPAMLQSGSEISTDGFENVTLEIVTSYNLTGLPPFTNYTILTTVAGRDVGNAPFAIELLQRTNTTVPVNPPTPPDDAQTPPPSLETISVVLPQLDGIDTGELYLYAVVVVTGNELNNNPVDIINAMDGNLPPPFPGQNSVYTAAVYTRTEDIPTILVLGNDTTTTGPNGTVYINRRLNENTMYGVFVYIRLKSDNGVADEGPLIVSSEYIALESTTGSQEDNDDDSDVGLAVGASIAAAFIVLIVAIAIIIIARYWWQHHRKAYNDGEVAYTGSESVVQNIPPHQHYRVQFQAAPTFEMDIISHIDDDQDHPDGDNNHPDDDGYRETEFNE